MESASEAEYDRYEREGEKKSWTCNAKPDSIRLQKEKGFHSLTTLH